MFINKNILVTGGNGFIGSNLVDYLHSHSKNTKIYIFDRKKSWTTEKHQDIWAKGGIIPIIGDLKNQSDLEKLYKNRYDYIFHQAALVDTTVMNKKEMMNTNTNPIHFFANLAIINNAVLIYASSAGTYGNSPAPNIVGVNETPTNIYGISKLKQDQIVLRYLKIYPKIIGLRYFNVYGPGEHHKGNMASMIYQLYLQMKNNEHPRIFKHGEQKRDFVYIKDIIQANIKAALSKKCGIYNIGTGRANTFNRIIEILNKHLNKQLTIEYIDNPYKFYQNHTEANIKNDLSYKPTYTLEEGIKDYLLYLNK